MLCLLCRWLSVCCLLAFCIKKKRKKKEICSFVHRVQGKSIKYNTLNAIELNWVSADLKCYWTLFAMDVGLYGNHSSINIIDTFQMWKVISHFDCDWMRATNGEKGHADLSIEYEWFNSFDVATYARKCNWWKLPEYQMRYLNRIEW